jgi:hypothetical protein
MSKKRHRQPEAQTQQPRPRAFVPPACSQCTALRPANTNYSRVYATKEAFRYCKCDYCGNTFKVYEPIVRETACQPIQHSHEPAATSLGVAPAAVT